MHVVFTCIYAHINVCITVGAQWACGVYMYICIYSCMYYCGGTVCMWCLGDKLLLLALSFRYMSSEDQTRSYQA